MTPSIRNAKTRQRRKERGMTEIRLWLSRHEADALADYAQTYNLTNTAEAIRLMIAETHGRNSPA